MSNNFTITIEVTVEARYADFREAEAGAESIAEHVRGACGNIVDGVRVTDVTAYGEFGEES